jgi:uncharacterized membrane protein affecting hemolysin expression
MKFLIFVKFLVVILCLAMFLLLMQNVWSKFQSKLNSTGVLFGSEMIEQKQLPDITICP